MNEIAAKCIEYARNDDYRTTAKLFWAAAKEINKLEHKNAELIYELGILKMERKKK